MYNQNNPNNPPKHNSYNYYPPQQHSVSPPPLQHPIPTHPPIQMVDPPVSSPSPTTQQRITHQHQNIPPPPPHQQGPNEYNDAWRFNDATTQMGMQFGRTAMMTGSEYVEKNINRYVNFPALKHYFKVNNLYVANKIRLLLFPWRHRPWSRLVKRSEQNGQMEGFKPPRDDINSPDLYIPAMALVTYVLLTGFVAGTEHKFHPKVLGGNATTASLVMLIELILIKMGCYLLNITTETQILDLLAYSGYKFIGVIVTLLVGLIAPFWLVSVIFIYTVAANGFFLLRSLRYVVFPDSTNTVNSPQRKKRIHFLFIVATLQLVLMYLLI
ncbi:9978_t:CDS:2 [Funneliformis caledonium]|uniref:Protein YIF1 n=1 Tax=Funneliformis caledonium TaxID=1117310 RepID=A0A9N9BT58_9GLOM|nr:9978_t:CDS:2 [Funneliformis caledonium]